MRWISHIAIAGSICAVFNPIALPAAVLGSTFPDWSESILKAITGRVGRKIKHRGVTHQLTTWTLLTLFSLFLWDWQKCLFWFAIGNVVHWFCDAVTISGAPVGWWSDRRITLFGGRVRTGGLSEVIVTSVIVAVCAAAIWTKHDAGGFVPFFFHWGELYEKGLIDGHEWRAHRFDFI
jgi:inner membrane protein